MEKEVPVVASGCSVTFAKAQYDSRSLNVVINNGE